MCVNYYFVDEVMQHANYKNPHKRLQKDTLCIYNENLYRF